MAGKVPSENRSHPIGDPLTPDHKKPRHHNCQDQARPHNPFDVKGDKEAESPVRRDGERKLQAQSPCAVRDVTKEAVKSEASAEDAGRERLKRHRVEVAGRVWIPDIWGQEELMKDWIDCSVFDASLVRSRIMSARAALMAEGRRPNSSGLRVGNRC